MPFDLIDTIIYKENSNLQERSTQMHLPAYYIFTNEELDKLVEIRPKTIEELKKANILTPVKIQTHGASIIEEINQ